MLSFYIPRIHKSNSNEFIAGFLESKLTEQLGYDIKITRIDSVEDRTNIHFIKCFVYTTITELPQDFESFTFYLPVDYTTKNQSIYWKLYQNKNLLSNEEKKIADNITEIEQHITQMMYELTEKDIGIPSSISLPQVDENRENVTENKLETLLLKEKEMNKMRNSLAFYANRVLV
jgi:hypothetical protein